MDKKKMKSVPAGGAGIVNEGIFNGPFRERRRMVESHPTATVKDLTDHIPHYDEFDQVN